MTDVAELFDKDRTYIYKGKRYKFKAYCPEPSIEMVSEDGTSISFGVNAPMFKEFVPEA